jgi:hypothetical protein
MQSQVLRTLQCEPADMLLLVTSLFKIVLQQLLTDTEVSSQEGCIKKVGELLLSSPASFHVPRFQVSLSSEVWSPMC